jgi:hypothetical protein
MRRSTENIFSKTVNFLRIMHRTISTMNTFISIYQLQSELRTATGCKRIHKASFKPRYGKHSENIEHLRDPASSKGSLESIRRDHHKLVQEPQESGNRNTSFGGFRPRASALSHRSKRVKPTQGPYSYELTGIDSS